MNSYGREKINACNIILQQLLTLISLSRSKSFKIMTPKTLNLALIPTKPYHNPVSKTKDKRHMMKASDTSIRVNWPYRVLSHLSCTPNLLQ